MSYNLLILQVDAHEIKLGNVNFTEMLLKPDNKLLLYQMKILIENIKVASDLMRCIHETTLPDFIKGYFIRYFRMARGTRISVHIVFIGTANGSPRTAFCVLEAYLRPP